MEERPRRRRGGLVGPVFLIGLGVLFLLTRLGALEVDIWWTLFRVWPVFLVAAGIDLLIGRRSLLGSVVALILIVAAFVGAFWLAQASPELGLAGAGEEVSYGLDGATEARVTISPAAAVLSVDALKDSASLIEGTIQTGNKEEVAREFRIEENVAEFRLQISGAKPGPFIGTVNQRAWNLRLNADVPLDLEISFGVGQANLDLDELTLDALDVDFGIGQTTIRLPGKGDLEAKVNGAIGLTEIVLPEGTEARIHLDTGLAARQLPEGYRCEDDVCTSPGYASAEERVDLTISMAIGNVSVREAVGQ